MFFLFFDRKKYKTVNNIQQKKHRQQRLVYNCLLHKKRWRPKSHHHICCKSDLPINFYTSEICSFCTNYLEFRMYTNKGIICNLHTLGNIRNLKAWTIFESP